METGSGFTVNVEGLGHAAGESLKLSSRFNIMVALNYGILGVLCTPRGWWQYASALIQSRPKSKNERMCKISYMWILERPS